MIALITDTHFGVRSESPIFLEAHSELLKSFFEFIDKNKIKKIIHLGDLFDVRKSVSSKLLKWVRENWIDQIVKRKIECIQIVGNHDTYFKSKNSPNTVREILNPYKNFIIVDEEVYKTTIGVTSFACYPWICPDNESKLIDDLYQNTYDIVCGHFDIIGSVMHGTHISEAGLNPTNLSKHGKVLSGHYHKRSNNGNIHYLGNPLATNWSEYYDQHGWWSLDETTTELKFHEFEYCLYDQIYINSEEEIQYTWNGAKFLKIDVDKKSEFWFQKLLNNLRSIPEILQIQINDNTIEKLEEQVNISEEELKDDLLTMMDRVITESLDLKDIASDMKQLLKELHNEVISRGVLK